MISPEKNQPFFDNPEHLALTTFFLISFIFFIILILVILCRPIEQSTRLVQANESIENNSVEFASFTPDDDVMELPVDNPLQSRMANLFNNTQGYQPVAQIEPEDNIHIFSNIQKQRSQGKTSPVQNSELKNALPSTAECINPHESTHYIRRASTF